MPSHPHCHWRGTKEWQSMGLGMSTSSDEACKMFDASLTQIVNHFDDTSLGGTETCMEKMFQADPNFVMGHVLKLGSKADLVQKDFTAAQEVYHMMNLSRQPNVKPWERKHAEAVKYFCEGKTTKASQIWEDILVEKPTDVLSLKFLHDTYIITGNSPGLRDSCSKAVPHWKPNMPFYGDVLGMYAFGLEEMNMYTKAEQTAKQALEVNRFDAWASHCVAHVKEMTGEYQQGIQFMSETENNWNDTNLLCHNYWHWALYYMESGDFETAMSILDTHVIPFLKKSESMFAVTDVASLLFRLEAEGHDVGSRWDLCHHVSKDHLNDNIYSYFDVNAMLACLRTKNKDDSEKLMNSIKETIKDNMMDIAVPYREVTLPIMEAFQAYDAGDFDAAVNIMKPLKYEVHRTGGSHAQRDLYNIFTIHAAMRSERPENKNYASNMLMERQQQKGHQSPLAERLLQKLLIAH